MSEEQPPPALGANLDFISNRLKKALDDMAIITAKTGESKNPDEDWGEIMGETRQSDFRPYGFSNQ